MTAHLLSHPYEEGTRVCHAKENTEALRATGSAEVMEARPQSDGSYEYLVRTDAGEAESWPSYFTVPVTTPARGRVAPGRPRASRNAAADGAPAGAPPSSR